MDRRRTESLLARAREALVTAREILPAGLAIDEQADVPSADGALAEAVAQLREWLAKAPDGSSPSEVRAVSTLLSELHTLRWDVRVHLVEERERRFAEVRRGLRELRTQDRHALVDGICESVLSSAGFDRVLVSRVENGVWRPWRSLGRGPRDAAERHFAEWLAQAPRLSLDPHTHEGDLVEGREALIVFPGHDERRMALPFLLARPQRAGSYVAASLSPANGVVGMIHADYADKDVTPLDRDVLAEFARGFDLLYERAVLLDRLREQKEQVSAVLASVDSVFDELAGAEMALGSSRRSTRVTSGRGPREREQQAARRELSRILSAREIEVLSLMATGASNDRIAAGLHITTDTVKSHVKNILRKLGADNRAQAIAHYLRVVLGSG
ncbi:MAG: helix-turn-helix transcriptional regulator [Tetrasphaera sp.]